MAKRDEQIKITEGVVNSKIVMGLIKVYIGKSFWAPDIYVYHPKYKGDEFPGMDGLFMEEVLRVMVENGILDNGPDYSLSMAESGMQDGQCTIFEVLYRNGKNISREFCVDHSAVDEQDKARKTVKRKVEPQKLFVHVHAQGGLVDGVSACMSTRSSALRTFKKSASKEREASDGLYECDEDGDGKIIASFVDGEFN